MIATVFHLIASAVLLTATSGTLPPESQSGPAKVPRVLIDEGHNNFHTSTRGYAALARLLRQNGFEVASLPGRFTADALAAATVVISASPLPEAREVLVEKAQKSGEPYQWSATARKSAHTAEEIAAVQNWVAGGGSLLIVVDHAPNGGASQSLAAAFGVDVRNAYTSDGAFQGPTAMVPSPSHFLFTRRAGLGDHVVLTDVDNVMTYTGTSLKGPAAAAVLLRLPSTAVDRVWNAETKQVERMPADGRAQAVAFDHERGRVIVLGEAGMLTSDPGTGADYCGMRAIAQADLGNRRFALNVVRWLARQNVKPGGTVAFANTGCLARPTLTLAITGAAGPSTAFDGAWVAALPNQTSAISIDLKVEAGRVTGELTVGAQTVPLLAGSIKGSLLEFTVKSPNGVRTVRFAGTLRDDEISFTREVEVPPGGAPGGTGIFGVGGPRTFSATRER